jgi:hypothetical protein
MQDWPTFCRQRLRATFLRRRRYPLGSDDRAHCVREAQMFLRAYRPTIIARVLDIAAPSSATADEMREWVEWWKPSYRAAQAMSDEQRAYLKQGGWWPPVSAHQIDCQPPAIVAVTARPGLHNHPVIR